VKKSKLNLGEGSLPRNLGASLILASLILIVGCHHKSDERHYDIKGKVVSVDRQLHEVTIAHQSIPGYMEAMTMPYAMKEDWALGVLKPGDEITATLVLEDGHSWLQEPVITEEAADAEGAKGAPSAGEPKKGDQVPDFTLLNQDSARIHLSQYKGQSVVLTFVYTRCPLPDYCPLMSLNFAELNKDLRQDPALYGKTLLLTVTIDPRNDNPQVMRAYGTGYSTEAASGDFQHWEFATGTETEIKSVAEYFGLRFWSDSGQIVHSLRTAVIGPDGKLIKLYRGNDWKAPDIMADLKGITT
jgi:protein SCO1/2